MHHNVLAIALANKPGRIAWSVLHKARAFEEITVPRQIDQRSACEPSARGTPAFPKRRDLLR